MENWTVLHHVKSFFGKAMNVLIMLIKKRCILTLLTSSQLMVNRNKESFFELYEVIKYGQGDQIQ